MIKDMDCADLTENDVRDLCEVFVSAFEANDAHDVIDRYRKSIDRVLILYEHGRPAAFLFFQVERAEGVDVAHMSLSAKKPGGRGVQKKLGGHIFYNYLFGIRNLFRLCVFATVSANPRSYLNMYSIGEWIFPDVIRPNRQLKYGPLYIKLANMLSLSDVCGRGILTGHMGRLGFSIKPDEFDEQALDGRGMAFMRYIGGDVSNAILVMVFVRPVIDIPRHYAKKTLRKLFSMFYAKSR